MATFEAPAAMRWVAGLPLPNRAAAGGFGVEVAFDDDAGTFVTIADDGRFARVLLARLQFDGKVCGMLALKVQRDAYRSQGKVPIGNRDVELRWRRELDRLRRLAGRGAVSLVTTGSASDVMGPVAFDRRSGRLFPLVSPRTWQPLRTCRDDAALRAARLQPWSNTSFRYLHDPADRDGGFWTWAQPDGVATTDGARVGHRHDLFRDLVAAWAALAPEARRDLEQRLPDVAAVLADLGAETVEQRIVPLAFHDTFLLCTELQEVHFDEYCDLVAGAPFAAAVPVATSIGRAAATAALQARLAGPQQWLTAPWTNGSAVTALAGDVRQVRRLAVEATFLKLQAVLAVCRAIAEYHAEFDEPHLGVAADNVMLRAVGSGAVPAPARWCFEVALTDVSASMPVPLDGRGAKVAVGLCAPALDGGPVYHSAALAAAASAHELAVRVQVTPIREQGTVVGLRCEFATGKERSRSVCVDDIVRLQPESQVPELAGPGAPTLLARVTSLQRHSVVAEFRPDPAEAAALADTPFAFAATATCHRRLRPVSDMFSVGMLLARALLVHDERDLGAVRELWDRLLDRLDMMCAGQTTPESARVAASLRGLLDGERGQLDSASVLWPKELRLTTSSPLPPMLWRELLLTIGRLLTEYPGFSWATMRPGAPAEAPDAPMRRLIAHLDGLLAVLRVELTEQSVRREEIAEVAESLMAEIEGANTGRPGGKP